MIPANTRRRVNQRVDIAKRRQFGSLIGLQDDFGADIRCLCAVLGFLHVFLQATSIGQRSLIVQKVLLLLLPDSIHRWQPKQLRQ